MARKTIEAPGMRTFCVTFDEFAAFPSDDAERRQVLLRLASRSGIDVTKPLEVVVDDDDRKYWINGHDALSPSLTIKEIDPRGAREL